jgi:hypothetical protein
MTTTTDRRGNCRFTEVLETYFVLLLLLFSYFEGGGELELGFLQTYQAGVHMNKTRKD